MRLLTKDLIALEYFQKETKQVDTHTDEATIDFIENQ